MVESFKKKKKIKIFDYETNFYQWHFKMENLKFQSWRDSNLNGPGYNVASK